MNCPKCHKSYYFLETGSVSNCICRTCGFKDKFVQPSYVGYHRSRYGYELIRSIENDPMLAKMNELIKFNKNDYVVDFGCGAGDYSHYFQNKCKKLTGVDINVIRAKERFPGIDFRSQNLNGKLEFHDNSVDKIICVNVIEHVQKYDKLLKEFERILKPSGLIFITTFDRDFILHLIHNDPTHVFEWNEQEFSKILSCRFVVKILFKHGSYFNYYPLNRIMVKFLKPEICVVAKKHGN